MVNARWLTLRNPLNFGGSNEEDFRCAGCNNRRRRHGWLRRRWQGQGSSGRYEGLNLSVATLCGYGCGPPVGAIADRCAHSLTT